TLLSSQLFSFFYSPSPPTAPHSFPTRRSSDLIIRQNWRLMASPSPVPPYLLDVDWSACTNAWNSPFTCCGVMPMPESRTTNVIRSEEHTSELQSLRHLVCRLLLEKKKIR